MKDVEDNNVYLALDDHKSDEFVLKQNLAVLIANKNATLESVAQEMVSIPAALVRMKWQNRREIYALQAKKRFMAPRLKPLWSSNQNYGTKSWPGWRAHTSIYSSEKQPPYA